MISDYITIDDLNTMDSINDMCRILGDDIDQNDTRTLSLLSLKEYTESELVSGIQTKLRNGIDGHTPPVEIKNNFVINNIDTGINANGIDGIPYDFHLNNSIVKIFNDRGYNTSVDLKNPVLDNYAKINDLKNYSLNSHYHSYANMDHIHKLRYDVLYDGIAYVGYTYSFGNISIYNYSYILVIGAAIRSDDGTIRQRTGTLIKSSDIEYSNIADRDLEYVIRHSDNTYSNFCFTSANSFKFTHSIIGVALFKNTTIKRVIGIY